MSINFHILAEREVIVKKTGKVDIQSESLDVWQTPTDATMKMINSDNPLEEYFKWVREYYHAIDYVFSYGDDCVDMETSSMMVCRASLHIHRLKKDMKKMAKEGYEFRFDAW